MYYVQNELLPDIKKRSVELRDKIAKNEVFGLYSKMNIIANKYIYAFNMFISYKKVMSQNPAKFDSNATLNARYDVFINNMETLKQDLKVLFSYLDEFGELNMRLQGDVSDEKVNLANDFVNVSARLITMMEMIIDLGDKIGIPNDKLIHTGWRENAESLKYILNLIADQVTVRPNSNVLIVENGCYVALNTNQELIADCNRYLITEDKKSIKNYYDIFERYLLGGLINTTCSKGVFDLVIYLDDFTEVFYNEIENAFSHQAFSKVAQIKKAMNYLKDGGVFVTNIASFTYTDNLAKELARPLEYMTIVDKEDASILIAKKNINKNDWGEQYKFLRRFYISHEPNYSKKYLVNNSDNDIPIFRSSIIDEEKLMDMYYEEESILNKLMTTNTKKVNKINAMLPLNVGQLGLILTSGALNGVVKEENNCAHVVKGRIVRTEEVSSDEEEDGTTSTYTTAVNRVALTVITPDGEFKEII